MEAPTNPVNDDLAIWLEWTVGRFSVPFAKLLFERCARPRSPPWQGKREGDEDSLPVVLQESQIQMEDVVDLSIEAGI
jgi:hypothetical protein